MPRPAINDYIFYKIVNVNGDVDLCYVGSTANWKQRHEQHKNTCKNETHKGYNCKLYKTIRENGGWQEFKMVEIGKAEQLTLTQARQKEEEYRVELKANMNTHKCFTSCEEKTDYKKQYRIDNIDKVKEYHKQYHIDNADKKRDYDKQYRINNADKLKEYHKQYRIDNADKVKQYLIDNAEKRKECYKKYNKDNADKKKQWRIDNAERLKEKHICDCGGKYTTTAKARHLKSQKHQAYINHTDGM